MTLGKALPPQPPYTLVGKDESEQDVRLLPLSGDLRGGWEWEVGVGGARLCFDNCSFTQAHTMFY